MTKLFEVGDKVRSCKWDGVLKIAKITDGSVAPVVVYDAVGDAHTFTLDGKYLTEDIDPSLYHAVTGSPCIVGEPPERFEYPLYFRDECSAVTVKFDGLHSGIVVESCDKDIPVEYRSKFWKKHTDRTQWTPCDGPVWKPSKPTWCNVSKGSNKALACVKLIVGVHSGKYVAMDSCSYIFWDNAEPCGQEQIPDYWPEEWA